jgi:hypothetical protein
MDDKGRHMISVARDVCIAAVFALAWAVTMILVFDNVSFTNWFVWAAAAAAAAISAALSRRRGA